MSADRPVVETLRNVLATREPHRQDVRRMQRLSEPRLAYGRHYGPVPSNARTASVLVLLYGDGEPTWSSSHIALTRRSARLPDHPGQICFPGGMAELDESPEETALREWEEELGCSPASFRVLGELNQIYVFASNFLVTPLVAVADSLPEFKPNPDEVDEVIELPGRLLWGPLLGEPEWDHHLDRSHAVQRGDLEFIAPCLRHLHHNIWGATLQMLVELACYVNVARTDRINKK